MIRTMPKQLILSLLIGLIISSCAQLPPPKSGSLPDGERQSIEQNQAERERSDQTISHPQLSIASPQLIKPLQPYLNVSENTIRSAFGSPVSNYPTAYSDRLIYRDETIRETHIPARYSYYGGFYDDDFYYGGRYYGNPTMVSPPRIKREVVSFCEIQFDFVKGKVSAITQTGAFKNCEALLPR